MFWDNDDTKKAALGGATGEKAPTNGDTSATSEAPEIPTADRLPQAMPSFLTAADTSPSKPNAGSPLKTAVSQGEPRKAAATGVILPPRIPHKTGDEASLSAKTEVIKPAVNVGADTLPKKPQKASENTVINADKAPEAAAGNTPVPTVGTASAKRAENTPGSAPSVAPVSQTQTPTTPSAVSPKTQTAATPVSAPIRPTLSETAATTVEPISAMASSVPVTSIRPQAASQTTSENGGISLSEQARSGTSQAPDDPSADKSALSAGVPENASIQGDKKDNTVSENDGSSPKKIGALPEKKAAEPPTMAELTAAAKNVPPNMDYKSDNFVKNLFEDGNECVTAVNGSFQVKEDTRALLALFSNGRFFVSEAAKFDGKVLGFQYQAKKRHLQIGKPEYVPTIILNDIYEYALQAKTKGPKIDISDAQEQARMQRDFVTIVTRAAANHVSDIHIVVADHTTVMFRVNGLMQTEMEYNKEWGESFVRAAFASSDISDSNYAQNEYQAAQKLGRTPLRGSNGRLMLPRNVLGIRLQFNPIAFGTRYVVMRLLYAEDDATSASDLEVLGFGKREAELFYQLRSVPVGIVIISGPTGSGKSTTLQRNMIAMLQEHNYETNLITVEDPPEYPIPGARQMPVTNATLEEEKDREFNKALAAALRSDPDSLMIGEIRTLSAADLAFRGALSGHNVWTTLHANSAPAVILRLKDMGVEDFKLQDPGIMKGVLAQRLFRKLCPCCRVKASEQLSHPAVQRLHRAFGDAAMDLAYLRGPGCKECDFRGVRGRTVVAEFILPDATFLDLMVKGEVNKAMSYWLNELNGQTLREAAISRMLNGIIDIEEVEHWTGFLDQQILI